MIRLMALFLAVGFIFPCKSALPRAIFEAGAWTEFYTYEIPNQDDSQIRSLQGLRLRGKNIGAPGLSFFMRGRAISDISKKLPTDPDFRVFGAYVEYQRPNKFAARAGRQFVSSGIGGLTIDGGRIDLSPIEAGKFTAYAGAMPGVSFYNYDRIAKWDERNVLGGQLSYSRFVTFQPSISFQQRNSDENVDSRIGGIDAVYNSGAYHELAGVNYDFLFDRIRSVISRTDVKFKGGHRAQFEYYYRRPTFALSDVFSVFDNEPFHQLRVSPMCKIEKDVYAQGSLTYTIYDGDNATRLSLGGAYRGQSIGAVYANGYAGTRLGIYGFLFRDLAKQLRVYLNADMYNYKLDTEEDDTTPSVSTALGAIVNLAGGISSRAEIQYLSNRDLEYDTRFYLRIGYNFTTSSRTSAFEGGAAR